MATLVAIIPGETEPRARSPLERYAALACLAGLLAINIALINLRVADFPVRALAAIGLLGAAILIYPDPLWRAMRHHALILWLALALALIGTFASVLNDTAFRAIWRGIMEVPLQVVVTLLVASVLVQVGGYRASALTIAAVIGMSAAVAVIQFVGIEPAWALREMLGKIQDEPVLTPLVNRRPMGLSYSPIQLSTQLCLAFAVYAAMRERRNLVAGRAPSADPLVIAALVAMVVGSIATLTRSPILGALVFFVVYALRRPGSWVLVLALLGGVFLYLVGPLLWDLMHENAPRVIRTDDNSANARVSMNTFGLMLFADNPLGYGFAFNPSDHWTKFWNELYYTPHPTAVTDKELHNYALNMLNTYGVGLLLVVPLVVALLLRGRHAIIFFIPYMVHIIFHNSGPFWTDVPFWFAIAALSPVPAPLHRDARQARSLGEIPAQDENFRGRAIES